MAGDVSACAHREIFFRIKPLHGARGSEAIGAIAALRGADATRRRLERFRDFICSNVADPPACTIGHSRRARRSGGC
jgi:hypothetical protein